MPKKTYNLLEVTPVQSFLLLCTISAICVGCAVKGLESINKDGKSPSEGVDAAADGGGSDDSNVSETGGDGTTNESIPEENISDIPVEVSGAFATKIDFTDLDNQTAKPGTNKQGLAGDTCSSWSASSGKAIVGLAASTNDWLTSSVVVCSVPRRLYCINSKLRSTSETSHD